MLHLKETITAEDILSLIEDQTPEGLHLDYKSAKTLKGLYDKNNREPFSKYVSAFANSDGGAIILGVNEIKVDGHLVPSSNDVGIDKAVQFSEDFDRILDGMVVPKIEGMRSKRIDLPDNGRYVVIITIPASDRAPHQAQDKRYYHRVDRQAKPMEEYEVREKYLKNILAQSTFRKLQEQVRETIYKPTYNEVWLIVSQFSSEHGLPVDLRTHTTGTKRSRWSKVRSGADLFDVYGVGDGEIVPVINEFFDAVRHYIRCHSMARIVIDEYLKNLFGPVQLSFRGQSEPGYWYDLLVELILGETPYETCRTAAYARASSSRNLRHYKRMEDEARVLGMIRRGLFRKYRAEIDSLRAASKHVTETGKITFDLLSDKIAATYPVSTPGMMRQA